MQVIKFALFLVVETADNVSPPPTNVTTAPVVSNRAPLIAISTVPPPSLSTVPDVTFEPPSIAKLFTTGGASIDFQSLPL